MVIGAIRRRKPPEWGIKDKAREEWLDELVGCLGPSPDPEALEKTKEHCRVMIRAGRGSWTMGALFKVARGFYAGYLLATKPERYKAKYEDA